MEKLETRGLQEDEDEDKEVKKLKENTQMEEWGKNRRIIW